MITFSSAARLRMLSLVATLDWKQCLPGLFLTLTYPPEIEIKRRGQLNVHRQVFWRYVEKHYGKRITALWRIEWQPRKSGTKKGVVYPHHHFLIFGQDFIPIEDIWYWWKKTTGSKRKVVCYIEKITDLGKAGVYVAKYSAKADCSLDYVAYHNSIPCGRNWGVLRKNLLPTCQGVRFRVFSSDKTQDLREIAAAIRELPPHLDSMGFTLLGEYAKVLIPAFVDSTLERELLPK